MGYRMALMFAWSYV